MKTDENYCYPENLEELLSFINWNFEFHFCGSYMVIEHQLTLSFINREGVDVLSSKIRFPLPTIKDLKDDDVIRPKLDPVYHKLSYFSNLKDILPDVMSYEGPYEVLIGRNTWVDVKVGEQ